MPQRRRLSGWLVAAALAVAGCSAGTDPAAPVTTAGQSASASVTDEPTAASTASSSSGPATADFDGRLVTVDVAGDRVSTADARVIVTLNSDVRLVVTSDTAHEVHVHGVDASVDVSPGQPATLDFVADVPGTFEVELEDTGELLFTLQVQP